jgi:hypothetical protein
MKPSARVDISAKAEAKLSVKGEIPQKSMGRLVDSITDIFRPFSEARGLRADHIRLQREEVAIEIARRARERLAIEQSEIHPVESKILIPLIEKASLEDIGNDEMIDRWSALLASASKSSDVEPRYVQILSEVTSRQAGLFEAIASNSFENTENARIDLLSNLEDAPVNLESSWVRKQINDLLVGRMANIHIDSLYESIISIIDVPGATLIDIIVARGNGDFYSLGGDVSSKLKYDKFDLDLEILSSLGLLKRASIFYMTKFKDDIQVVYYHITELGVSFFRSVNREKPHPSKKVK